jgi:hypothetical protein
VDLIEPQRPPQGLGLLLTITRDHHQPLDPERAQPLQGRLGVRAQGVAQRDQPHGAMLAGDIEQRLAFVEQAFDLRLVGVEAEAFVLFQIVAAADDDPTAIELGAESMGDHVVDLAVRDVLEVALARRLDHGLGQGMSGMFLDRGDHGEQGFLRLAAARIQHHDIGDFQLAVSQGSGLVEHQGIDLGQTLHGLAALDQYPMIGGLVESGLEGDRGAELERAGVIDQEHRLHPRQIARQGIDGRRRAEREIDALVGQLVGQSLGLGALVERVLDEAGDTGGGGVLADPGRLDAQPALDQHRAGDHALGRLARDRHVLAGDGGLIDQGGTLDHTTVDRDGLADTDDQDLAGPHLIARNPDELPIALDPGEGRCRTQQSTQQAVGLLLGALFQILAEGEQEIGDIGGVELAATRRETDRQGVQHLDLDALVDQGVRALDQLGADVQIGRHMLGRTRQQRQQQERQDVAHQRRDGRLVRRRVVRLQRLCRPEIGDLRQQTLPREPTRIEVDGETARGTVEVHVQDAVQRFEPVAQRLADAGRRQRRNTQAQPAGQLMEDVTGNRGHPSWLC